MDNIFFDTSLLKKCGKNVIIGKTVRIRYPELVELSDNVIIDDFCYISTSLKISSFVHISSGCKILNAQIGENCNFKSVTTIGEKGFGFTLNEKIYCCNWRCRICRF